MTEWVRGEFERSVLFPGEGIRGIKTAGWIRGDFGISKFCGGGNKPWHDWSVYHLNTGCAVPFCSFDTVGDAKRFVNLMMARGSWAHLSAKETDSKFRDAVIQVREQLGMHPLMMRRIS